MYFSSERRLFPIKLEVLLLNIMYPIGFYYIVLYYWFKIFYINIFNHFYQIRTERIKRKVKK
ncbi:hypothetical protein X275_08735 [Marinitoga sp. 1197]|nr:hypothetical protein X274_10255 [Marinitoga sp. 1155]KLO21562.1 hypothetical protein X275_08735 [Marinitoga sp. 1197]NUV00460.1 hypothetical protein [Marinitoga sp. 1154]